MADKIEIMGYMHIIIESITVENVTEPIFANIAVGDLTKVDTAEKVSGSAFNEIFLLEIPENPPRLAITVCQKDKKLGECRYDITPFSEHEAIAHTV